MGTTSPENVQLGEVLVCAGSFAVSTVFVVEARAFSGTVCRSGSFPFARSFVSVVFRSVITCHLL
jgi:hypothetical protein